VWRDYETALYHQRLAWKYNEAANFPWLPLPPDSPPPSNSRDEGALAQWTIETLWATATLIGILAVLLTIGVTIRRAIVGSCLSRE
jgi:hypothetical protein